MALTRAAGELAAGHVISVSTSKTLRLSTKTQTARMQEDEGPSPEPRRDMRTYRRLSLLVLIAVRSY